MHKTLSRRSLLQRASALASAGSLASLSGVGGAALWMAQTSAHAAKPAGTAKAQEISWDDLIPAGWDPSAQFSDLIDEGAAGWQDTDPRAQELYQRLREVWDNAPVVPEMAGKTIRLPGYVVALEETKDGLTEMLLVPNFGACIHTPPPPANQIIHVKLPKPQKGFESLDAVWVTGPLEVAHINSELGVSGYSMNASAIEKYRE